MRSRIIAALVAGIFIAAGIFIRARTGDEAPAATRPGATTPDTSPGGGNLELACAHEAKALCDDAVASFNATQTKVRGRLVTVRVTTLHSGDMADRIATGGARPDLWLPAMSSYIDTVNRARPELALEGTSVAQTPIAIGVWADRAQVLAGRCTPVGIGCLHDVARDPAGWTAIGGDESWGQVELTFADPLVAADGVLALAAAAMVFRGQPLIDPSLADDPRYHDYLRALERARTRLPGGDLAAAFVASGPARAEAAITYEASLVAQLANARGRYAGGLRIFYPEYVLFADFPLVRVAGAEADQRFAEHFLHLAHQEGLGGRHGFRAPGPVGEQAVSGLLADHADEGVIAAVSPRAPRPEPAVFAALATLWKDTINQ